MLRQALHEIRVSTRGRGLYEFTGKVADWVSQNGFTSGLVTLHLRHTSASLLIQENADPDVRRDLEKFFARLVPDGDPLFAHTVEGRRRHARPRAHRAYGREPFHSRQPGPAGAGHLAGDLPLGTSPLPHSRTITAHFVGE